MNICQSVYLLQGIEIIRKYKNKLMKSKNLLLQNHLFDQGQFQPNLIGTKHPWETGIQVYSNERPSPFPSRDNNEIVKRY